MHEITRNFVHVVCRAIRVVNFFGVGFLNVGTRSLDARLRTHDQILSDGADARLFEIQRKRLAVLNQLEVFDWDGEREFRHQIAPGRPGRRPSTGELVPEYVGELNPGRRAADRVFCPFTLRLWDEQVQWLAMNTAASTITPNAAEDSASNWASAILV